MDTKFSTRLSYALKLRGKRPVDLSDDTGLSQSLISQYLNDKFEAKNDKIAIIAQYLNISPLFLMGWSDEIGSFSDEQVLGELTDGYQGNEQGFMRWISSTDDSTESSTIPTYHTVPLYTQLSCGTGMFVDDNIEEYITLPESLLKANKEYFCQYASGDSMIDENIIPGDLLVFEKTQSIDNGQVGCFCIDDNVATCKKFYKDDASAIITLQPANSKYAPIIVTVETMNFHIIGKLSLVINKRD